MHRFIYPQWTTEKLLLPVDATKYKFSAEQFRAAYKHVDYMERGIKIEESKSKPIPSIHQLRSWEDAMDWSDETKLNNILKEIKKCQGIINVKFQLIQNGIQDRMFYNPDDDTIYGWIRAVQ